MFKYFLNNILTLLYLCSALLVTDNGKFSHSYPKKVKDVNTYLLYGLLLIYYKTKLIILFKNLRFSVRSD